jgi:DNA-directed RNA polymerase sigma subunit (sigma70/sigma32)
MDSTTAWMNAAAKRKLSVEETNKLFVKLNKQEKNSKEWIKTLNRICEGNLLLVVSTVSRYVRKKNRFNIKTNSPLFLDLLQVGYLGLRFAAERYDMNRAKFSTCAVPWILQRLGRYLIQHEQSIYIPEGTIHELFYYRKHKKHSNKRHAPKTLSYIVAAAAAYSVASLDKKVTTSEDSSPLIDLIPNAGEDELPSNPETFIWTLKEKMAEANIPPKNQDLMVAYARTGRKDAAAVRVGCGKVKAAKEINATINILKQLPA